MLKYIIVTLLTLEFILFSSIFFAPVNATENEQGFYLWDYASVGNTKVVCKQVMIHPEDRLLPAGVEMQPASIQSHIVENQYCKNLTQPAK
ncbi:MAG: hypothetical protein WBA77_05305 [Microcoleaceae cyanobacterium]